MATFHPALAQLGKFRLSRAHAVLQGDKRKLTLSDFSLETAEVRPEVVRIVGQELRADTPVPIAELERVLLTRVGDPVDEDLLGRSVRRLLATDLFASVEVDRVSVPGGIKLMYRAMRRQRIRAIRFSGNLVLLDRELRDALSIREGGDLREEGAAISAEELATFYRDRGYLDAEVTSTIEIDSRSGDWLVNFAIREGLLFKVRVVLFEGPVEIAPERLHALLRSQEGAAYNGRTFRADLRRLEEAYLSEGFYSATFLGDARRRDEEMVDLVIQVREGARTEVRWQGVHAVLPEALDRLLTFREERIVDEFELESSRSAIETHYHEQGFPLVVVRGHLERGARGRVVTFTVEEGPRYLVGNLRLEGNATFPSSRLLSLLKSRPNGAYVETDIGGDVENLTAFYRGEGFLGVEVTVAEQSFDSARNRVALVLAIREGVRTVVRAVEIHGTRVLAPSALLPRLHLKPGLPLREEAVEADKFAILDRYGQEGYIYAVVTTNLDFSPDRGSVRVVHTVEEKHQARLGSLLVVGNERTQGRVFRREIPLSSGDPYRYQAVLDGQQRIYQLGIVRSLRLIPLEPELEPQKVDLLLRVEEGDAGRFAVGGGYSSEERLRGFIEVGHRNLWGSARSVTFRLRLSEIGSRADVTYVEPWVFRRRMDGEVNLFTDFAAGGLLGGPDDFVKAETETSWFVSLAGLGVLAVSLRGGLAAPYGQSDRVPIHERFFAGGSNSVRGFIDRGVCT